MLLPGGAGLRVEGGDPVPVADLVLLGGKVALPFLRLDVDDDGAFRAKGPAEGALHRLDVVPVHGPEVEEPEVVEEIRSHERVLEPVADLPEGAEGPPPSPGTRKEHLRPFLEAEVALGDGDEAEPFGDRPPRGGDRHLVVVEDEDRPFLPSPEVVERLEGEPALEGAVAEEADDLASPALYPPGVEHREDRACRGARVPGLVWVVGPFPHLLEAARAPSSVQVPEGPPGEELPGVALVADVEDEPVPREVENPAEGDRRLHRPEVARKMPAPGGGRPGRRAVPEVYGRV